MNEAAQDIADWNDVKPLAEAIFRIWTSGGDLRWAEEVWKHFVSVGLATYSTRIERVIVDIRLMTLGSIYLDWCAVAYDERHDDEPVYWLDATDISPIHLGQLIGPDVELDDDDPAEDAVHMLILRERPRVLEALFGAFGEQNGLYVSLWRAARADDVQMLDDDDQEQEPPSDWDVLDDDSEEKMAGYMWLTEGCEQLGPVRYQADFD